MQTEAQQHMGHTVGGGNAGALNMGVFLFHTASSRLEEGHASGEM